MIDLTELSQYGVSLMGSRNDALSGAFKIPSPIDGQELIVIASAHLDWDHVSVSRRNRCPNWVEMEFIAKKFFKEDETAIQYHVPAAEHLNLHPYCLHWWRPQTAVVPKPPPEFVAFPGTIEDNLLKLKNLEAEEKKGRGFT